MTPDQQAALEKIKKLLRMKRGGTPDEIATALRLAQEMAQKHGIDMNTVDPDTEDRERPLSHEDEILGARIQWECKYAMIVVDKFFHVSAFLNHGWERVGSFAKRRHKITFVGSEWDRQIAIYVYHFLVRAFRRAWKHDSGRCRNRQAFLYGMFLGISTKLRERQPKPVEGEPGLVLLNAALTRRSAYIGKHFGKLTQSDTAPDHDADAAMNAGFRAGLNTEIRSGLGSSNNRGQQLLA